MKKIKELIKKNKEIIIILFISLFLRLLFEFQHYDLWWDEATYISIGKFIYSYGQLGFWEPLRPILLPVILGFFWKIGLPVVLAGRLFVLFSSLGVIFLVYLIGKKAFNKETAIAASIFMSFSIVFFIKNFLILTEITSIFFILLAVYLFLSGKRFLPGLFIGLSLLMKFPGIIFIAPLLLALVIYNFCYKKRDYKTIMSESALLISGFFIAILPYLILNQILYNNAIFPLIESRVSIVKDVYCNVKFFNPWHYYLKVIFLENPLTLFSLFGLYISVKKNINIKKITLIAVLLASLLWFSQLHCRHYRYAMYIIPFVVIFSGYGIAWLLRKKRKILLVLLILFMVIYTPVLVFKHNHYYPHLPRDITENYYKYLEGVEIDKEVWISSPWPALYTNRRVNLIYYPIYDYEIAKKFNNHLINNSAKIGYIFWSDYGGVICGPSDLLCNQENKKTMEILNNNFERVYFKEFGKYTFYIFKG